MEEDITAILSGQHVPIENKLDFQNEISKEDLHQFPVTKRNVCYICCCVLFNEEGQVLLVQEAKQSCYGEWYLPAGRLEPKETLIDGARRELKEEAGLESDFYTLLCVEIGLLWFRFTFTGKVTGGKLKTTNEKDKESLQAKFFSLDNLPQDIRPTKLRGQKSDSPVLRCNDILRLIKLGKEFHEKDAALRHQDCIPVTFPHKHLTHRIVIINRQTLREGGMHVLISTQGNTDTHIPCLMGSIAKPTNNNVKALVSFILSAACTIPAHSSSVQYHVCGILGVEHRGVGEQEDGMCITYLVNLNQTSEEPCLEVTSDFYFWHPISNKALQERLSACCLGQIVPLLY